MKKEEKKRKKDVNKLYQKKIKKDIEISTNPMRT